MHKHLFDINLQLFAEGASSGAAAPAPASTPSGGSSAAAPATAPAATPSAATSTATKGTAAPTEAAGSAGAADVPATPTMTPEERKAAWEKARSEYRDLYEADAEDAVMRRIRNTKKEAAKPFEKALKPLYAYYGIKAGDVEALEKAINGDDQYFEPKAIEAGMPTRVYREFQQMQDELAETREEKAARLAEEKAEQEAREQIEGWKREEAELRKIDPDFNFAEEYRKNDGFRDLISRKVSMEAAYKATRYDTAIQQAVKQAQESALKSVMANGARPAENGLASSAPASVTEKPLSQMTREERDEFANKLLRRRR